jgi:hypothetical protein
MRYTIMVVLCLMAGGGMMVILWLFRRRIRMIETQLWEARKAAGVRAAEAAQQAALAEKAKKKATKHA